MITARELYEDLKNNVFYDLEKAYTYIHKKYNIKPKKELKLADGLYVDTYELTDGNVEITGFNSDKRHLKVKCHYVLVKP